jgi:membrane-bound lytic murein transglycosylase B
MALPLTRRRLACATALLAGALLSDPPAGEARAATPQAKPRTAATRAAAPKARHRAAAPVTHSYAGREDAMRAADDIASRRDLDPAWTRQVIGQAQHLPQITRWVLPAPAGTAKNWRVYRSRFIDPVRIAAGVAFWQAHADALERAEREFGVPAAIIVGIIGVETIFGRQVGNFRVIDALATLSFDFPLAHPRAAERRAFFLGELEQLLSLARRGGLDPASLRGSYAGAMGLPQFMPSSWVRYAIDFDGDGRIDLFRSPVDVIGSVANYFQAFGWKPGMPTHYPVQFAPERLDLAPLLGPDILPTFQPADLAARGVLLDTAGQQHTGPLALVELQNGGEAPQYLAGTENFYVVTRYNWSSYYAMAVIELGEAIARAR